MIQKDSRAFFTGLEHAKILIVDDEPLMLAILSELVAERVQTVCLQNGTFLMDEVAKHSPDLILLDVSMPEVDGLTLCRQLKGASATAAIPVIFITGMDSQEQENACWQAQASDFIRKPFNELTVLHRIYNHLVIKLQRDSLERLTLRDGLTGLFNRRFLDMQLEKNIADAKRHGRELVVMMVDVDYFKKYNDLYGHQQGDDCLQFVSSILLRHLKRPADWVARYGGEEFVVVLPETDWQGADMIAAELLADLRQTQYLHEGSMLRYLTVSIGIAQWDNSLLSGRELLENADKQLYLAKQNGRNQVA